MAQHPHRLFHYEHRGQQPLDRRYFAGRMMAHFAVAVAVLAVSLLLGIVGYVGFEHLTWTDAFLNAAMLLGGMGPIAAPQSFDGKLFAGLYVLYCGLVVILVAGLLFAPLAHRLLHRFHLEDS